MTYEFEIVPAQYDVGKREIQLLVGYGSHRFYAHNFGSVYEIDEFITRLRAISDDVFGDPANFTLGLGIPAEVPGFW